MPIQSGDIKLIASKVMDDVPNGGGGPSAVVIQDGDSNSIFADVTERQRAIGGVSIRQLHGAVQTGDTSAYMDPTIVLSKLPNDPNVSITLAKTTMFARRTDIANAIENYLIASSEWGGYLLENHVAGQRSIQLFQRPGMPPPTVGRTLVLVQNEGLPSQVMQYVRVTKVTTTQRTFTYSGGGTPVDYVADVLDCDLTDVLRSNFAGSPPNRFYVRDASKTVVRDTTVANAATFYGAAPLTAVGSLGDSVLRVSSVYTQLVPSARTESAALDQKPAAQRVLTLAESPRRIDVGVTPHTMRIRVGQENRSFAWVQMLKPLPARGTIVISYMALGNWYTLMDDGSGAFTGSGVGTVNYQTGSLSITLPSIPDAGTSIIFQWGENTAYTSRAGQAGFRAPEFAWALPHQGIKPGSAVVTWLSGGVLKTATDSGQGVLTGASGGGEIDYATGKIYLRPTAMIDAGGEFVTDYEYQTTITENFNVPAVDAGGFGSLPLTDVPAAKSVTVRWITVRNVSASSGTSEIVSESGTVVTATVGAVQSSGSLFSNGSAATVGQSLGFTLTVKPAEGATDTYSWEIFPTQQGVSAASICAGGATTGTFLAIVPHGNGYVQGTFALAIAASAPVGKSFVVRASNSKGEVVATSTAVNVVAASSGSGPNFWFGRANIVAGNEDGNGPLMAYGAYALPGELLRGTLDIASPNTPGTYSWHVEGYREDTDPASLVQGGASTGTFTVSSDPQPFSDVIGKGEFTFTVATNCPTARFSISVKNQSGDYVGHSSVFQVYNQAPPPPPEQPPTPAIQTREPISTGRQANTNNPYIAGMYLGGVDGGGKRLYVGVDPSFDRPDYGAYYDPPASATEVWTEAQLAYGKPMTSLNGRVTTYRLWNETYLIDKVNQP